MPYILAAHTALTPGPSPNSGRGEREAGIDDRNEEIKPFISGWKNKLLHLGYKYLK
jgi:hypothetical protein